MSARRFNLASSRGLAIAVLSGALLAACTGGDPAPSATTMHPGTAATATPTPSGNPTDIAAAAAIAAVQNLYTEYNAMLKSLSSSKFRATFTKACTYCTADAKTIDEIHERGGTIVGGSIKISGLRVALAQPELVIVEGDVTDTPATVRRGGRIVDRYAGGTKAHYTWRIERVSAQWLVADEDPVR